MISNNAIFSMGKQTLVFRPLDNKLCKLTQCFINITNSIDIVVSLINGLRFTYITEY